MNKRNEIYKKYQSLVLKYQYKSFYYGVVDGYKLVSLYREGKYSVPSSLKDSFGYSGFFNRVEGNLLKDLPKINVNTTDRIEQSILRKVWRESYYSGAVGQDLKDVFNARFISIKGAESVRIARTEVHSMHSLGRYNTFNYFDVPAHKWVTMGDNRVRNTHRAVNGETVKLGERFSNGLRFPGDRTGSIKEWINCRCGSIPSYDSLDTGNLFGLFDSYFPNYIETGNVISYFNKLSPLEYMSSLLVGGAVGFGINKYILNKEGDVLGKSRQDDKNFNYDSLQGADYYLRANRLKDYDKNSPYTYFNDYPSFEDIKTMFAFDIPNVAVVNKDSIYLLHKRKDNLINLDDIEKEYKNLDSNTQVEGTANMIMAKSDYEELLKKDYIDDELIPSLMSLETVDFNRRKENKIIQTLYNLGFNVGIIQV